MDSPSRPIAPSPFRRVFVANRGEIAARIERTCRALGIEAVLPERDISTVAGAGGAQANASGASRAVAEGAPAALDLLDGPAVVAAAVAAGADALHPGYGFLSENAAFAAEVERAGLAWIGPPPAAIAAMGDKAAARQLAAGLGVPVLPGYDGEDQSDERLAEQAERIGYPVLIKPAAGGGGKGMREVREPARLGEQLAVARRAALAAFGDDRLILERLLDRPRHIEVQVLFDRHGSGVHLGERDCSYQRRHQKVLEESPAPAVTPEFRERIGQAALTLAGAVGYQSAGTVEFLAAGDPPTEFFFLEMNTRLQVEHPVTELVTGRDLVADQIRIAAGEPLGFGPGDVRTRGHAIEVRLYAEDPDAGFLPATGRVLRLEWPYGEGIRVDAGIEEGSEVGGRFDPMLAKLIAYGRDRAEAIDRLARALDRTVVLGVTTNLHFLRWLLAREETRDGQARVDTLERIWQPAPVEIPDTAWGMAAGELVELEPGDPWSGAWRLNASPSVRLDAAGSQRMVSFDSIGSAGVSASTAATGDPPPHVREAGGVHVAIDGRDVVFRLAPPPEVLAAARAAAIHAGEGASQIEAPMPGNVLAVHVAEGDEVDQGDPIVTLAAMKMEHAVAAPAPGRVVEITVGEGDQVSRGQVLAVVEAGAPDSRG